ncbi:MAG TPA: hypothetical protein VKS22_12140 [Candidatus Binataceae bacterium]|nr:hypothetical protein [Candidatus Binataceae bacterium]
MEIPEFKTRQVTFAKHFDSIVEAVNRMRPMLDALGDRVAALDGASAADDLNGPRIRIEASIRVIDRHLKSINLHPVESELRLIGEILRQADKAATTAE